MHTWQGGVNGPDGLRHQRDSGQALVSLMAVLVLLTTLGAVFISSMNFQQRLAGDRLRAVAALYLAEAGTEKALWYLEGEAPDGTDDASWRPVDHSEELHSGALRGRFTVTIRDEPDGLVSIVSWGEAGGKRRGVRVIARVAPGVLDHAVFGAGLMAIEGDEAEVRIAESRRAGCARCPGRVLAASNTEIWFPMPGSSVQVLPLSPGHAPVFHVGVPDLNSLTVDQEHKPARYMGGLRLFGIRVGEVAIREIARQALPSIDAEALRRRATANHANADLNRAAGKALHQRTLRDKEDSLYTAEEFALLLRHLGDREHTLTGPIVVAGPAVIPAEMSLTIVNGFLATEGGLTIEPAGRLTVRHSGRTRLLPGLITRGADAAFIVGETARVSVDGVVLAEGVIEVRRGAALEVTGALVAADPQYALRLHNASLTVRYDPALRGTAGLIANGRPRRVVALSWHEIR